MKNLLLFVFLCLLPMLSFAGVIQVYPIHVFSSDQQQTASVHLKNTGDVPLTYQATMFRWSQKNGADVLDQTSDVLVSPTIVMVPPHEVRIVRFMRLHPQVGQVDTYKLLLRQLPGPAEDSTAHDKGFQARMRVLVNQLLPVVFAPSNLPPPNLVARMDGHGVLLRNQGAQVIQLQSIGIKGQSQVRQGALGWLLPGGGLRLDGSFHRGDTLLIDQQFSVVVE